MFPRLPAELSALVLDELAQPDVIRLAHVSTSWRVIAIHHSKFYADFTLVDTISRPADPGLIEALCSKIEGAAACSVRLDITVAHRQRSKRHESEALRIVNAIRLGLPHLVRLYLDMDTHTYATVSTALRDVLQEPAPVLESLELVCGLKELPMNFLDGTAPKLRLLNLSNPGSLLFAPVFPSVRTVSIDGSCGSMSNIGTKFPFVTHMVMGSVIASPDTISLAEHIPTLRSLRFDAWSELHLPWVDVSAQTQDIPSITAYLYGSNALFTQYAPAFIQCLGAGISLSVFEVEKRYKNEVVIRFQSGSVMRTILRGPYSAASPEARVHQQGESLLVDVVPSVASRITHLTFDYLLLPFVAPAVAEHLWSLERIEVDFHRLLTDSPQDRDDRICRHDVLQRHVVDPTDFDKHRTRIQAVCQAVAKSSREPSLVLTLKSREPIWFPAHEVLALVLYLDLPSHVHVQNTNLVLEGVVEEPEDARLLQTVFSEVKYVGVAPLPRSSV